LGRLISGLRLAGSFRPGFFRLAGGLSLAGFLGPASRFRLPRLFRPAGGGLGLAGFFRLTGKLGLPRFLTGGLSQALLFRGLRGFSRRLRLPGFFGLGLLLGQARLFRGFRGLTLLLVNFGGIPIGKVPPTINTGTAKKKNHRKEKGR
jgi:hypothetical protein